jgi:hypothetical protein
MPENKFDSGHAILPVLHPDSGEVHNIAVPTDTSLSDLHSALAEDYAHPALASAKQPTAEGAIENSEDFRAAARKAWGGAGSGLLNNEGRVVINKQGAPTVLPTSLGSGSSFQVPTDSFGTLHTHPDRKQQDPSDQDISTVKSSHKPMYIVSSRGLYMVRASDGKAMQIFQGTDWMKDKKKK